MSAAEALCLIGVTMPTAVAPNVAASAARAFAR
jgi:hypothetical protein